MRRAKRKPQSYPTCLLPRPPAPVAGRRRRRAADILAFLLLLLGAATVGVSAWGLAESIKATDTTVSDFWVVVDQIHGIVSGSLGCGWRGPPGAE